MKRTSVLLFAASLTAIAGLTFSCGKAANTVKIGSIMTTSGAASAYGVAARNGIQMAFDEINAKGGLLGKQIQFVCEDDQGEPEKATNAFKKLVSKDKIKLVVGATISKSTLAIGKDAQNKKVVLITPTSTNDQVTDAGDFIFRSCFRDSFQGVVMAKFANDNLKVKNVAILYDNTNDYSTGLTKAFTETFTGLGGKIVESVAYANGDQDYNAQLTKIKAAKPEAIFIPDYYSPVSLISKQLRAQGITVPLLGADGWDSIVDNAGDEVLNSYYSNHYTTDSDDPDVKNFIEAYKAKYNGEVPNSFAALGYDAAYMLADAITAAGSTDSVAVRDALAKTNKKFVTGQISFDEKHNPVKSAVIIQVVKGENGKLAAKYSTTINP